MTGLPTPRTVDELVDRLEDACRTLRRIPSARHSAPPADMRSGWPDYLRDAQEAYGYETARGGRILASAAEIARMDQALGWIARWWSVADLARAQPPLPEDAGAVAWLRAAAGWNRRRVAAWRIARWGSKKPPGGTSREALRLLEQRALEHMLSRLSGRLVAPTALPEDEPPPLVWDVVLDRTQETRVIAIRSDGTSTSRTRHVRAEWREVPKRRERGA